MIKLSKEHARRFLTARHALRPPRSLANIAQVMSRLGSLQVDPLAVTGLRNHDLVLAARISDYQPSELEHALYVERSLIEVYDKSLCIVPLADLPFHRAEWERTAAAIRKRGGAYQEAVRRYGSTLLRRLDRDGPLPTRELGSAGKRVVPHWGQITEARAALLVLVRTGKVMTVRRQGNTRFYDRIERVVPKRLLERKADHESSIRHRVLGRFRAMGLLGLSPNSEVFISTTSAAERARIVADLVAEKELLEVEVRDVGRRFIVGSDRALIDRTAKSSKSVARAAFVAPLDPMIWDRTLLGPLFGIDYKWGVYTPRHARIGGYYDLPVVYGDQLVGFIEPVFARKEGQLRIVRLELFTKKKRALLAAIRTAVEAHAHAIGAASIDFAG